ncbi:MAG: DNA polymerase, partial [Candidatus Babeliales bacterium]
PKTDRIHTTFSQTSVETGRLASSRPNLQNIPASSSFGLRIREAFRAEEGKFFLSADYSQMELRVLACLADDPVLQDSFLHNRDIHTETAAYIFDIDRGQVTQAQRQIGKRINFSIMYGLTPYGLSRELGISVKEATTYINSYFKRYAGVAEWMKKIIQEAEKQGYVTTYYGRRRYIRGIHEKNKTLYQEACRIAVNTVVQGTAAEIMKLGMIKLDALCSRDFPDAFILLQIHDELLVSVPIKDIEAVKMCVKKSLEESIQWVVPFVVAIRTGKTWKDVTK